MVLARTELALVFTLVPGTPAPEVAPGAGVDQNDVRTLRRRRVRRGLVVGWDLQFP
jgi:hypothetical protein